MSAPSADRVPELFRAIRADLAEVRQDMAEARQRPGHLEAQYATVSVRLDRMAGDLSRIRDRLGLIEA